MYAPRPSLRLAACPLLLSLACSASHATPAQAPAVAAVYADARQPPDARADDLVSRLTLEEKVGQMMHDAPAIERLGIPAYNWCSEALHGVARAGLATVFPQAIGLAATWDEALMREVATAISDEARAKHHAAAARGTHQVYQGLTLWSPNINLFRDPRWGRGQETYGEDPLLTGRLAVQFVRGLQGDDPRYLKTVATLKHFAVHSGPEPLRHEFDARVDLLDLYQTYLPQFELGIREGGAESVMCAYNRVNGEAACAHDRLLNEILRGQWGFKGYVVSDCRAIEDLHAHHHVTASAAESAALAVRHGTDLECGTVYANLADAVRRGLVTEAEIDRSVKRLFLARLRLGMLDDPAMVPYAQIPYSVVDSAEHRALALRAAEASIVLLRNSGDTLPLRRDLGSIAVIGPNADQWLTLLGNYNGVPAHAVTPLEGIRKAVSPRTRVVYAQGSELAQGAPVFTPVSPDVLSTRAGSPGLELAVHGDSELAGAPLYVEPAPTLDVIWADRAPRADMADDNFGVRWTGRLTPRTSGSHQLGVHSTCNTIVRLNGETIVETTYRLRNELADPRLKKSQPLELKAGQAYELEVVARETYGDARVQLVWAEPRPNLEAEALAAARGADAVVMVMGLNAGLEGEQLDVQLDGFRGGDRTRLELPEPQQKLVRDVTALGKPVVLVALSGSALALTWEQAHVPAILAAWYPGQAAGDALARVLFGDTNPAGRLPVTFYRSADDLPPFDDYHITTQTYRFFGGKPLYPFGYGLSYSRFHYDQLELPARLDAGKALTVAARVTNVGRRPGEEVAQAYVAARQRAPRAPLRALAGFQRLQLAPGESARVEIQLPPESFATVTEQGSREYRPGTYDISIGGGQPLADVATTSDYLLGQLELAAP
ncbi:MAG TPA: glycoside hydrolase family 3 C-terminal domain-containing protein [Polyangiaceae bacterium]|nr:glycoside hydrolase family 3 C-terminal domain-containing protein [Polyangiaceae bacterium]